MPPALGARSLNHWTAGEVPPQYFMRQGYEKYFNKRIDLLWLFRFFSRSLFLVLFLRKKENGSKDRLINRTKCLLQGR